jgi:hypothetical protein
MKKEEERKMVFAKHKWCLFEVDREDNHFFFFFLQKTQEIWKHV